MMPTLWAKYTADITEEQMAGIKYASETRVAKSFQVGQSNMRRRGNMYDDDEYDPYDGICW